MQLSIKAASRIQKINHLKKLKIKQSIPKIRPFKPQIIKKSLPNWSDNKAHQKRFDLRLSMKKAFEVGKRSI